MRYIRQSCKERAETEAFRVYVTDSLMLQGQGKYLSARYYDLMHPTEYRDFDADEVIDGIIERAGLEVIE